MRKLICTYILFTFACLYYSQAQETDGGWVPLEEDEAVDTEDSDTSTMVATGFDNDVLVSKSGAHVGSLNGEETIHDTVYEGITDNIAAKNSDYLDHYVPYIAKDKKIYIEKFAPIYIQDFSTQEISRISGTTGDDSMGKFLSLLDLYNSHLYRAINNSMLESIKEIAAEEKVLPIYMRDFNETSDSSVRFIITNNFSIIDIYQSTQSRSYSNQIDYTFYIYDREENIRYKEFYSIEDAIMAMGYIYELQAEGKLAKRNQEWLDKKLDKFVSKQMKERTSSGSGGIGRFAVWYLLLLVIVNIPGIIGVLL